MVLEFADAMNIVIELMICRCDRGRILAKRINVRVEHVKHSRCRQDFLDRVAENERKKKAAKEAGTIVQCRRQVFILNPLTTFFIKHHSRSL